MNVITGCCNQGLGALLCSLPPWGPSVYSYLLITGGRFARSESPCKGRHLLLSEVLGSLFKPREEEKVTKHCASVHQVFLSKKFLLGHSMVCLPSHEHTRTHVRTHAHTCTHKHTLPLSFSVSAKQFWVISWGASSCRSGSEGWTDEPEMNSTLHRAVTEAHTWEGTTFPCMALLSTLLASKQSTSPLLWGTREGYSNSFMGQEKREFGDSIIFSFSMGHAHIFFPIALVL